MGLDLINVQLPTMHGKIKLLKKNVKLKIVYPEEKSTLCIKYTRDKKMHIYFLPISCAVFYS